MLRTGHKVGVGKGGANRKGAEDEQFTSGIGYFHKSTHRIRRERRFCERCHKDLINVGRYFWCVHHRDRNRANNCDENFELLCKRCHQIEHNCIEALRKRNDYPVKGVGNSVPEAQGALEVQGGDIV